MGYGMWPKYVPVSARIARAQKALAKLNKKGSKADPVVVEGRNIAGTFWGRAWCDNLESFSDYENRLPRGRTYVRNGFVIDLQIAAGQVRAMVQGTSLYRVTVDIRPVAKETWRCLVEGCAGSIASVIELLQGKLSQSVMERLSRPREGLFPEPKEISLHCSCPDGAYMCKHIAAALYGVGARLDARPELLFLLRGAKQAELVARAAQGVKLAAAPTKAKVLAADELSDVFGIEMDETPAPAKVTKSNLIVPKAAALEASGRAGRGAKPLGPKMGRKVKFSKPPRQPEPPPEPPRTVAVVRSGAGQRITSAELLARGIPRKTVQSWLASLYIEPSGERGVYLTTAVTAGMIERALAKQRQDARTDR